MKSFLLFLLIPVFILNACNGTNQSDLDEALSWSCGDDFLYDNWTQINADFGWDKESLLALEWVPNPINNATGQEISSEREKDNFSPYASNLFRYEIAKSDVPGQLGYSYPEIKWEAKSQLINIIKLNDDFEKEKLEKFTGRLEYETATYRGITIYFREPGIEKFDKEDALWASVICGIGYSEPDNILLLAPTSAFLKKTIDAHLDKHSLLEAEGMRELASKAGNAESLMITKKGFSLTRVFDYYSMHEDSASFANSKPGWMMKSFGISLSELESMNSPVGICVGEMKGGKSFSILQYKNEREAAADKEKRLKILKEGKSIQTKRLLNNELFDARAEVNGKSLLLYWSTVPSTFTTYTKMVALDMPWLYSKQSNN